MSYHHRYKPRDFQFAQRLWTLRKRAGLTQEEVALQIGVSAKTIRNWEGGTNYPSDVHLRKLSELYLAQNAFVSGSEQDEVRSLWEEFRKHTTRRIGIFDEQWLTAVLHVWHEQSTGHTHQLKANQSHTSIWSSEQYPSGELPAFEPASSSPSPLHPTSRLPRGDWCQAPDVPALYGRADELAELERWLLADRCRLVAVLGMGGIGKTALTVKLVEQVAPHFDCVLWRSLHNAPPLEDVLRGWLLALAEQHAPPLPQGLDQSLALLIGHLQAQRCLLVLDNLETLFQEGVFGGRYREGYEEYATLIRYMAETTHQSCLVLTCRELLPELGAFTGKLAPVRVFRLGGLMLPAAQQLLQDKDLFGDQESWNDLRQRYAGNPLALKIVSETVCELFGGDIPAFLREGFATFHGISQILTQQFERLSALEQALMYWLAIERELTSLEALREDLGQTFPKREVIEAMHSLRNRSLVERGEQGAVFTLQPVVSEYVTERLVELVSEEIREGRPALLLTHALLQAQAKDYIRVGQAQLMIQSVLHKLARYFDTPQSLQEQLRLVLQQLRTLPHSAQGYGGGNILNLWAHLNGHIRDLDCSHLTIWQAWLQGVEAQDVKFCGSDLRNSVFTETISGVSAVALSPDGKYLAVGGFNGQIHLWLLADGTQVATMQGHVRMTWSLAFSPDSTILTSGGYDGLVKLWEVSSGRCLQILHGHTKWVRSVAFRADGNILATSCDDGSIRIWKLENGKCLKVLRRPGSSIWSITFGLGDMLVSGSENGEINVWDVMSGRCRRIAQSDTSSKITSLIVSLAVSPDGASFVSGEVSGKIRVWDVATGECLHKIQGQALGAWGVVAFGPDGVLASAGHEGAVKLWHIDEEGVHHLRTLQDCGSRIWSLAFNSGGILAYGSHDGMVKLWQVSRGGEEGQCLRLLQGYWQLVSSIAFSPDGTLLINGDDQGMIRVWRVSDGRCLRSLREHVGRVHSLAFNTDGSTIASGADDTDIKIWDVSSGQCLKTLQEHTSDIWSVVFSPDGKQLASSSLDLTIKLWELSSGRCIRTFRGHKGWPWSVAFSPDGKLLASGSFTGEVKLWEVSSGRCLKTMQGASSPICALAFTSDANTLVSSSSREIVKIWEVSSGQALRTLPGQGYASWLRSVAWSQDGNLLAIGSDNQEVEIWEVSSGLRLNALAGPAGQVWSVAFGPDNSLLATGTDLGTIVVWEVQTCTPLKTLRSDRPYERMNISGVTGITEVQKASLRILGAIEDRST